MLLTSLPTSLNTVVRIRCFFPWHLSPTSSFRLKSLNSNLNMLTTTQTKTNANTSFGFAPPSLTNSQSTCNICKRLLYSFEEILICRVCHGSYHWRCVKPDTTSYYGENTQFICDNCNDNKPTNSNRLTNGNMKTKSDVDYRNFTHAPSKSNTTPTKETTVVNTIRYFEEKQQQQSPSAYKTSKLNEFDGHHSSQTNGQYTDDMKTNRRMQQQTVFDGEDENITAGAFQANYQYTPLKEYAATKNTRTNGYQNSPPSPRSDHQTVSHYNDTGLHYTTKSPTNFTTPTMENLSLHNRQQQHFISSTNLNVNDRTLQRQQQTNNYRNPLNHSSPYLSHIRDYEQTATFKSSDHHSTVGSDSGIVMINSTHHQQQQQQQPPIDENQIIEKKLTSLVQQLGRQLETDAQKLSEKLEIKLKNLEYMIHQQTYVIRRQDEVIERLKTKILKIENERDHFRDRLSVHEQRQLSDEKKYSTDESTNLKTYELEEQLQTIDDLSMNRKFSTASSALTEQSRPSSKKTPAPRVDQHGSLVNNENEPTISKFVKTIPVNQEHRLSNSSTPSTAAQLIASVPVIEKPAAASRLDDIIHQSHTNHMTDSPSSYYNIAQIHHHDSKQIVEPVSMEEQQVVTIVHHANEPMKSKRSNSTSSASTSSSSSSSSKSSRSKTKQPDNNNMSSTINSSLPPRSSTTHRSLETIPRKTSQTENILKPTNKTASLEFGKKPVGYDDPGSIYITPQEVSHPASDYQNTVKGWLRKQNRDSFFKRVEPYYCVLSNNTLLMHKDEHARKPQKVINLRGAKVLSYQDQKYGPSLELTWSKRQNDPKHYHLYAHNEQEVQQWLTGIQNAIAKSEDRNKWQPYRMQI